jgi:MurNAc alpha-1-phosphate uridylyltransferase
MIGETAFILAAGLGTRMRPLTDTMPKPLITVGGKRLIDHAVEAAKAASVKKAVVNAHYFAGQIEAWSRNVRGLEIAVSDEREALLDTGGGICKALPLLGREPFFVLNSDGLWIDRDVPALVSLRQFWRDDAMDCLLLLSPLDMAFGYDGTGDFHMENDGRLVRRKDSTRQAYAYIGGYLVHPRLFNGAGLAKFSMNVLWDKAIAQKRLFGLRHEGVWLHVGTPEAVAMAEAHLASA